MEAVKTPSTRAFLHPELEQVMSFSMGLRDPIDVQALKQAFSNSIMIKHPRFSSLMVRDHNKEYYWKRTHVNIDDHFIIHHPTKIGQVEDDDAKEAAINEYLADWAVSNPLSKDKPLWEVHVLMGLNCIVLRVHHAIGDGCSVMSMLSACFGKNKADHEEGYKDRPSVDDHDAGRKPSHGITAWKKKGFWGFVKAIWLTLLFLLRFAGRVLWIKDKTCVLSGGDGVELWPRKVVTAKFKLQDFKSIKNVIPNATINDVLLGIIASGLSKYLEVKSPKEIQPDIHLLAVAAVNLRGEPFLKKSELIETKTRSSSSWGNKSSVILVPILCRRGLHPLEHVKKMKATMDQMKQSYEAQLNIKILRLIVSILRLKVTHWIVYRTLCNTSLTISNIVGPPEEMVIADNHVTYLRANICSLPHAITMYMVSYAGNVDLQISLARDIIPDSEFMRDCFHESFLKMMEGLKVGNTERVEAMQLV